MSKSIRKNLDLNHDQQRGRTEHTSIIIGKNV